MILSFLIPFKLTFITEKELWPLVYYDIFVDSLFFIDVIIKFNTPIYSEGRLVTDRKQIAIAYLKTWFFIDLFNCLPMSFIKKVSEKRPRSPNDLMNLLTLNWNSLPRFYPMMYLPKMLRIRNIFQNMRVILKRIQWMTAQLQNIIITLYMLLLIMNFVAGLLKVAANFNLKSDLSWV